MWSVVWVSLGLLFSLIIYALKPSEPELVYAYLSAFLIEKMLSIDNLFVFILVFSTYKITKRQEHRILFWGIIGALVFRAIFIFVGVWLVEIATISVEWQAHTYAINVMLTLFGVFLIYTSVKMATTKSHTSQHKGDSGIERWLKKSFSISSHSPDDKFWFYKNGKRYITPMLIALISVELADLLFALDSIPAIFSVTSDRMVLYTSNIFAILGLRALYFVLSGLMSRLSFIKTALIFILLFVGTKMLIAPLYHISTELSLVMIIGLFGLSYIYSLIRNRA